MKLVAMIPVKRYIYLYFWCTVCAITWSQLHALRTPGYDRSGASPSCLDGVKVWGPGWERPELVFPSRYFFVEHPLGCEGRVVGVDIQPPAGSRCLLWVQTFNETQFGNNLLLVRYKLMAEGCRDGLVITLLNADGERVLQKTSAQPILVEGCVCRKSDWYHSMQCDSTQQLYQQIYADLRIFNETGLNFDAALSEMKTRFAPHSRSYSFCHYQIISNQIYRKCYGEYVGFAQFMDDLLKSLLSKTSLADTEMIVNLGDWPLSSKRKDRPPVPVFSWCGSDDTHDIVLPTYELTEATLNMQGRVAIDVLGVLGKQPVSFEAKLNKLFWRGRDSSRMRLNLVQLSKEYPDLIDAGLTNFFFFRDEMDTYGPTVSYTKFWDFFKFKYQLNLDGTVAAYRLPMLLAGSSLVLKQDSKFYEHFYHLLEPNTHFLKVRENLDDILGLLGLLSGKGIKSDQEMDLDIVSIERQKKIVGNANSFVLSYLTPEKVFCYYYSAFTEYTKLLGTRKVILAENMELIKQNEDDCGCDLLVTGKDEL